MTWPFLSWTPCIHVDLHKFKQTRLVSIPIGSAKVIELSQKFKKKKDMHLKRGWCVWQWGKRIGVHMIMKHCLRIWNYQRINIFKWCTSCFFCYSDKHRTLSGLMVSEWADGGWRHDSKNSSEFISWTTKQEVESTLGMAQAFWNLKAHF